MLNNLRGGGGGALHGGGSACHSYSALSAHGVTTVRRIGDVKHEAKALCVHLLHALQPTKHKSRMSARAAIGYRGKGTSTTRYTSHSAVAPPHAIQEIQDTKMRYSVKNVPPGFNRSVTEKTCQETIRLDSFASMGRARRGEAHHARERQQQKGQ